MRRRTIGAVLALAAASWLPLAARAGQTCDPRPPAAADVERAMSLAEHTAAALDRSGAQVVVLARAGRNLDEYGLRYSHLGFAYRDGDGHWRVAHKLNDCGTAHAAIYRQGLGQFFLDSMTRYDAGWVVPTTEVQARLLPVLRDDAALVWLHTPAYNLVAYPWSVAYQQSNQWALETLAMSQDPAADTRERAQAWLRLRAYQPTTLHLSPLKRLGARATAANVAFDDQPFDRRFSDRIDTVTVDSVFAWLAASRLGGAVQVVR